MNKVDRFAVIVAALVGAIMVAAGALVTTFHPGDTFGIDLEAWGVVVCVVAVALGMANEARNRRK